MDAKPIPQNPSPPPEVAAPETIETSRDIQELRRVRRLTCAQLEQSVNEYLHAEWGKKHNALRHWTTRTRNAAVAIRREGRRGRRLSIS